jgi:hypothetical protein
MPATLAIFEYPMPPRIEDVKIYFSQKGISEQEAEAFFHFYEKKQWTSKKGNFFTNWKCIAYKWIASVWKDTPLVFDKSCR